jgi:hypothetical protein
MKRHVLSRRLVVPPTLPSLPSWRRKTCSASDTGRCWSSKAGGQPRTVADLLRWQPEPNSPDKTLHNVAIQGYVRSRHKLKTETFVQFGDGSSFKDVQAVVPTDMEDAQL